MKISIIIAQAIMNIVEDSTMLSAIIGAIAGAISAFIFTWILENKRTNERKNNVAIAIVYELRLFKRYNRRV